jgi:excisionase family DNA binding protein
MDMSSYLKLPEVAQRLGVSEKTARRYIKSGTLPSIFVGNAYRVHPNDLDAFVERTSVGHGVGEESDPPKAQAPYSPALAEVAEERRTESREPAAAETSYTAYEALGRVLATSWKTEAGEWDEKIPSEGLIDEIDFGRLLQWWLSISDTAHTYEVIAEDAYRPQREELQDTLKLMEVAKQGAMDLMRRAYEPVKTYSEFQKIVKANNLEDVLSGTPSDA